MAESKSTTNSTPPTRPRRFFTTLGLSLLIGAGLYLMFFAWIFLKDRPDKMQGLILADHVHLIISILWVFLISSILLGITAGIMAIIDQQKSLLRLLGWAAMSGILGVTLTAPFISYKNGGLELGILFGFSLAVVGQMIFRSLKIPYDFSATSAGSAGDSSPDASPPAPSPDFRKA
ncbi:MAG: hypothetical protein Tsb009_19330 [Planctomycetaceae bacterium]